jgi:predicted enzyme related to lactoylglutathione lyase
MSERNRYPDGVPCWITALQHDPQAGVAFYSGLFGWECEPTRGFFTARLRGADVAAIAPMPEGAAPAWITQISVDSADATAERARAAGGTLVAEPFEEPMGRLAVIADPTGAVFSVKEPGERFGAQRVNEPGAWAMSQLATQDLDAAAAFYGELFGWTTEAFGPATMFRLPGYVGGEPEQPVSREVVAVMVEGNEGEAGWIPDFWVSDVDAVAARANAVTGPYDLPGMGRQAVLADPEGAVFSVTHITGK